MITPRIIIDSRELRSPVAKELDRLGADIKLITMEVGDYILSERVGVERKASEDFLKSWLDEKKIWSQLRDLANNYDIPLLIIEGDPMDIYTLRKVKPSAVQGILRSIMVSMRIPIIYSINAHDTATWLFNIAKSEQDGDKKKYFSWHGKRSHMSLSEQQEYIVSAVPDVGITTARALLKHFGSVRDVFKAAKEELMEVDNVGEATANRVLEVTGGRYR